LDHELLVADIHVVLALATREGPLELLSWREGERDIFSVPDGTSRTIQPDAFFQLKDSRSDLKRTFFLEADRSTMSTQSRLGSQRFRDKIERYRWFSECGRPFERYGVQSVGILTATLTLARRDNLGRGHRPVAGEGGRHFERCHIRGHRAPRRVPGKDWLVHRRSERATRGAYRS
jgi:hypothetical protein